MQGLHGRRELLNSGRPPASRRSTIRKQEETESYCEIYTLLAKFLANQNGIAKLKIEWLNLNGRFWYKTIDR
jgi:hypothetical protein